MDRTIAHIQPVPVSESNPYVIALSDDFFQKWDLTDGEKIWIRFGSERVRVSTRKLALTDETIIQIPFGLCFAHHFPVHSTNYTISYDQSTLQLRIGPIIALLTEKSKGGTKLFGNVTDFSRELYALCSEQHLPFFLFSLEDVEGQRINGYVLSRSGIQKVTFPLPDVIYNRISSRAIERSEQCQAFFQQCKDLGIIYFNDHFLSKWEVISLLLDLDSVAAHLPETHLYEAEESIKQLIDKHTFVFLKPVHGREGKGIIRIQNVDSDRVQLELSNRQEPIKSSLSKKTAVKLCKDLLPKEEYIVQQGVPLLDYEGGKVDFRILCNRDDCGIWRVTSAISRVSAKDRFVSNLSQGAKTYSCPQMLNRFFNEKTTKRLLHTMYELAINVSEWISKKAGGIFGEFGIDIGIDTTGHPWIIEINTKPSKQFLADKSLTTIRPSARGVFQFARYLSESAIYTL